MSGILIVFMIVTVVMVRSQVFKLKQGKKIINQKNKLMEKNKATMGCMNQDGEFRKDNF